MMLVFLLVIITGLVSYLLLNQSLNTISQNIQPDRRLLLTKSIYNELKDGENSVKSFSLTQHDEYLKSFYLSVQHTEKQLDLLREGIEQNDTLTNYLDSLEILIEDRFLLLDSLLEIQDEYRVQQALNNLVSTIHEDSLQFWEEEKEGFFKRLFKGKKKKAEAEERRQAEIEAFSREVDEIRREEILREQEIRQKELELIGRDRQLMKRISALLSVFDRAVIGIMKEKTALAEKRTKQISWVIGAFVFLASLLLIIAIFTIVRFIKRNNNYKKALKQAHQEALTLARTRESFLANMSHEIRTPMNVISGFTGQLLKGKMTKQEREQLRMIKNASDHLVHILNDILDFSRLEAGKMSLHEKSFVLEELLGELIAFFEPLAKDKSNILKLTLEKNVPKYVKSDPVRLRQVLLNLVSNSIKFTRSGNIDLHVSLEDQKAGKYLVSFIVKDTGTGIARKDLQKIFDEFEQSSSNVSQSAQGTGLGLAIVKKITDLFGGKIELKSQEGEGTEIRLMIPLIEAKAEEITSEVPGRTDLHLPAGLNILAIDDEEYNRQLLKAMLKDYKVNIVEAINAEDGLMFFGKLDFDIVLTDIRLPGMSGMDLTRKIRQFKDKQKAAVPVIALTASVTQNDQEVYQKAGMDDFLPKPVKEEDLVRMIAGFCGNATGHDQKEESTTEVEIDESVHFDLEELKRLSNQDEGFYREMIELFIRNTESGFKQIQLHFDKNEFAELQEQAHKIVSPARHIKAHKLIRLLKEIELLENPQSRTDRIEELLKESIDEFEIIKKSLKG